MVRHCRLKVAGGWSLVTWLLLALILEDGQAGRPRLSEWFVLVGALCSLSERRLLCEKQKVSTCRSAAMHAQRNGPPGLPLSRR